MSFFSYVSIELLCPLASVPHRHHFLHYSCLRHRRQQGLLGLFLSSYNPVAPFVELQVFDLQLRMLHEIGNTAAHPLVETGGSLETWYRSLQLGTVKDDGNGLVAQQVALKAPSLR